MTKRHLSLTLPLLLVLAACSGPQAPAPAAPASAPAAAPTDVAPAVTPEAAPAAAQCRKNQRFRADQLSTRQIQTNST